jgi:hypothetical protein
MIWPSHQARALAFEDVQLDQGEWAWRQGEGVIETAALGPCTGIIIHDPVRKIAVVGHFTDPLMERGEFGRMLDAAVTALGSLDGVDVWLGGGAPVIMEFDPKGTIAHSKARRAFVVQAVLDRGFDPGRLHVDWNRDDLDSVVMRCDLATGEVVYDKMED